MMLELREFYPDLQLGKYYHNAASMHIYEMHFEPAKKIISSDEAMEFFMPEMQIDSDSIQNLIQFEKSWRILQDMDKTKIPENEYYQKLNNYWKSVINLFFIGDQL